MGLKITNNATSTLAGAIDAAVTAISLAAGTGAKFPALGAGDWFPLTVVDAIGNYEILRCTARNVDLLTVARGQEGTAAAAFAAGSRIDLRLTAAAISGGLQIANNLSDLADTAAALHNLGFSAFIQSLIGEADAPATRAAIGLGAAAVKDLASAANIRANSGTDPIPTDQAWAAAQWVDLGNVAGAVNIDGSLGSRFKGTLTGNITVTFSNFKNGQTLDLAFIQDATGGRTVSWSGFSFPDATAPTIATGASGFAVIYSGLYWIGNNTMVGNGFKVS